MNTLLLDQVTWDLVADANGNIAMASDPYAEAQDAASAIKLFQGELYYDTTQGVPYWQSILGMAPNIALMKTKFVAAALTVPGVAAAVCFISAITRRAVSGQVQITTQAGTPAAIGFTAAPPAALGLLTTQSGGIITTEVPQPIQVNP